MFANSIYKKPDQKEIIHMLRNTMSEFGNPQLLDVLVSLNVINNYERLSNVYHALLPLHRQSIRTLWQILCLSGEENAFKYAVNKLHMNANTATDKGENPLHYAALSGQIDQIRRAIALGISWDSESKDGMNMLHYSILRGAAIVPLKLLDFERNEGRKLSAVTKDGRTILHLAALSGDIVMLNCILGMIEDKSRHVNLGDKDANGYNAMNYAVFKGNQNVIKELQNLKLTAEPNQDDFSFGKAEEKRPEIRMSL